MTLRLRTTITEVIYMLKYDEFKEKIINKIKDYLPVGYKDYAIETHKVYKVNEKLDGLYLIDKTAATSASPVIYLNHLYEDYKQNNSITEILKFAAKTLTQSFNLTDIKRLINADTIKGNIILVLINAENNEELLKTVPHKDFLDLAVIFRWVIKRNDNVFNSTIITNDIAKMLKLNSDELFTLAKENTRRIFPKRLENITDSLNRLNPAHPIKMNNPIPMYVLSNEISVEGAAYIVYDDILENIKNKFNESFYVIPSSINEVIIVPESTADANYVKSMLKSVNDTFVDKSELLSDNVYIYDTKLSICPE